MSSISTIPDQSAAFSEILKVQSEIIAEFNKNNKTCLDLRELIAKFSRLDPAELRSLDGFVAKIGSEKIDMITREKWGKKKQLAKSVFKVLTLTIALSALITASVLSLSYVALVLIVTYTALNIFIPFKNACHNILYSKNNIQSLNSELKLIEVLKSQYRAAVSAAIEKQNEQNDPSASANDAVSVSSTLSGLRSHQINGCDEELAEDVEVDESNESASRDQSFATCNSHACNFDSEDIDNV